MSQFLCWASVHSLARTHTLIACFFSGTDSGNSRHLNSLLKIENCYEKCMKQSVDLTFVNNNKIGNDKFYYVFYYYYYYYCCSFVVIGLLHSEWDLACNKKVNKLIVITNKMRSKMLNTRTRQKLPHTYCQLIHDALSNTQ